MNSKNQAEALPSTQEIGDLIAKRVRTCEEILVAGIAVPERHEWTAFDDRLSWWCGSPLKSSSAGVSFFIDRTLDLRTSGDDCCRDPGTIRAEVRLFLPKARYREGSSIRTYRKHSGPGYSAHLWVKTGPHWAFQSTSHLADKEPFVYADTLEELCAEVIVRINTALSRATKWIEQQRVGTTEETKLAST